MEQFRAARDLLLRLREDADTARQQFRWPRPERFNFAVDWFDAVLATETPEQPALARAEPISSSEIALVDLFMEGVCKAKDQSAREH